MKRRIPFLLTGWTLWMGVALLVGCSREDPVSLMERKAAGTTTAVAHEMIVLGDQLNDPYSVENVKSAVKRLYPTKADRIDLEPTHIYARFLPQTDEQLQQLQELGLELSDHPFDYEILKEGDYYQDPDLDPHSITWQYTVVDKDFSFPSTIRYEILDRCYIPDGDATRSDDGIDWDAVEREAFRLTGNEDMLAPETKAQSVQPQGRITIVDDLYSGGKPIGVSGVRVMTNVFVKFSTTYTDRDGYYTIPKKYSSNPRYRLVFKNTRGFCIGVNLIILPASVSTLGKGAPDGKDVTITADSDRKLFCRCVVNNAVYDYIGRCGEEDMDITPPPSSLRLWIFQNVENSSAVMTHHGAIVDMDVLSDFLNGCGWLIKLFAPDLTIGVKGSEDYSSIYSSVQHELAHCSHYARVGNPYWDRYITYIGVGFLTSGGETYGYGTGDGAGYCEVGEMWAYYLQSKLYAERYGGTMPAFGTSWWFFPQIFRYLDQRGFTRSELFAALEPNVNSRETLYNKLMELYPERSIIIQQVFSRYAP